MSETGDEAYRTFPGQRRPDPGFPAGHPPAEDLTAHALAALEPAEAAVVERHCLACPPCARHLADARRTVTLLPFLAPRTAPPPDVKAALFARIAQSQAAPALDPVDPAMDLARTWTRPADPAPTPTLPGSRPRPDAESRPVPRPAGSARPAGWWGNVVPLATATVPLVLALALVGGWAISLRGHARNLEDQMGAIANAAAVGPVSEQTTGAAAEGPVVKFLVDTETDQPMVTVARATPETSYKVWCKNRDGQAVAAGEVPVNADGWGAGPLDLSGPWEQYKYIFVAPADAVPGEVPPPEAAWASIGALPTPTPAPVDGDTLGGQDPVSDPATGGRATTATALPLSSP